MKQRSVRWGHAVRVALGATLVVGAVAVVLAGSANLFIVHRLDDGVDVRLGNQLAGLTHPAFVPPSTGSAATAGTTLANPTASDPDDVPVYAWWVSSTGTVTSLTLGDPALPVRRWVAGPVALNVHTSPFRFDAVGAAGGTLVVGESVARIGQVRNQLLIAEGVLGGLLLLVTFIGSLVVGLRASAPIEQVQRRQAEFTADASHELRTPLSVIEAEVDLALARPRDAASYQATLRRVSSESGRLRSIVEDLLWLARADATETDELATQPVDVAELGGACVERFGALADAASVTLRYQGSPTGPLVIRANRDAVDRLISVLLDNACKYAGPGGAVDLSVDHHGGRVVLTVDDSGPGIPVDHRDLVFDRFHRADDRPGGTGLGLAIADAVVRNSGGTWSVGRSPLGGARMEVSWRQVPTPVTAPRPEPQPVA